MISRFAVTVLESVEVTYVVEAPSTWLAEQVVRDPAQRVVLLSTQAPDTRDEIEIMEVRRI